MCPDQLCKLNATDALYVYCSVCFWAINWRRTYDAILQVIFRKRACSELLICYKSPGKYVILYTRNLQNETLHGSVCWCRSLQNGPTKTGTKTGLFAVKTLLIIWHDDRTYQNRAFCGQPTKTGLFAVKTLLIIWHDDRILEKQNGAICQKMVRYAKKYDMQESIVRLRDTSLLITW